MSAPSPADVEAIAEVLAAHDWRWSIRDSRTGDGVMIACTAYLCDWTAERETDEDDVWTSHRAHVAEQIAASPALATLRAHERATALRDAATEIPAQVAIARETRNRIAEWLRDRADRQEPQP